MGSDCVQNPPVTFEEARRVFARPDEDSSIISYEESPDPLGFAMEQSPIFDLGRPGRTEVLVALLRERPLEWASTG